MSLPHRSEISEVLSQIACCNLFAGLSSDLLHVCLNSASLIHLPRGAQLIRQGEYADSLYIIVEGAAEVLLEMADGTEELISILSAGDCVGDLAILLDEPRTTSVRTIRNCQVVRLSRDDILRLHNAEPVFSLRLARSVAQRLQHTTRERVCTRPVTDVTAIILDPSDRISRIVGDFSTAIASLPGPRVTLHTPNVTNRHNTQESIAESDVVLFVVDASAEPDKFALSGLLDTVCAVLPSPVVGVLLCHDGDASPRNTLRWLQNDGRLLRWHHARHENRDDLGRIARLVTGHAVGVALSGGGARGFAHIGVLKALAEAGTPVDFIAGTSMGAIIAAQYAAGFGIDRMIAAIRCAYIGRRGLPDITIPTVSLYSGRATDRKLKAMFGDRNIEDLPLPYFAVAADLRTAESVVLERGPTWQAARISCSIPGMLPPIEKDGRLLVDGGLLDNLPVTELRKRCAGRVIASDVSIAVEFKAPQPRASWPWSRKTAQLPSIAQIMMRTAQLASVRDSREAGTPADLYLNPQLNDVGMGEFGRLDEMIERGALHAHKMLKAWGKWP